MRIPGRLPIEDFEDMCDLTVRPQGLAERVMHEVDDTIGRDADTVSALVKKARTRFAGHMDVQIALTSLRVYDQLLKRERGGGAAAAAVPGRGRGHQGVGTAGCSCAVIGACFMGARIAAELLLCGSEVSVYDRAGVEFVTHAVGDALQDGVRCGFLGAEDKATAMRQLVAAPTIAIAVGGGCRLVCECVADALAIKAAVFAEVCSHCRADAVFGTLSMNLSLVSIQEQLPEPWVSHAAPCPRHTHTIRGEWEREWEREREAEGECRWGVCCDMGDASDV
eukprot:SAG25_NODE_147_length_13803_cov_29.064361_15_plen_280_part_00